jgi:ABC-type phosphonate transport system ATPase subunit
MLVVRLEAQDLSLAYGDVVALRNLTAAINGGVLGVLGATASGNVTVADHHRTDRAPGGELRNGGMSFSRRSLVISHTSRRTRGPSPTSSARRRR